MAIQGKKKTHVQFEAWMHSHNMHVPGNKVTVVSVDTFLGNKLPKNPTCADCNKQTLHRFSYIQRFKDDGLTKGRYTGKDGNFITTYAEEYNNEWVLYYSNKSKNAANRSLSLNNSTPLAHMHHQLTNDKHLKVAINALSQVK